MLREAAQNLERANKIFGRRLCKDSYWTSKKHNCNEHGITKVGEYNPTAIKADIIDNT